MGGKWQLTPNVAFAFWPSIVSSFPTLKFGLLEDVRFTCEVFKPRLHLANSIFLVTT